MNHIRNQDFSAYSQASVVRALAERALECSNKAIDEAPIIHTAWNHPAIYADPWFARYRAVEDSVLSWNFSYDEWPSYWNLVDLISAEHGVSRATATKWLKQAIDVGPWRCFVTFVPADAKGDQAMPTIRATRSASGKTLVFRCPYCRRTHEHGAEGDNHRHAHCDDPERFPGGYHLRESLVLDDWRIALVRDVWHYVAARYYVNLARQVEAA